MTVCPVCKKEYQNLKIHLVRQSKNDSKHKKYYDSLQKEDHSNVPIKTYKKGDIVEMTKNRFEIIEDLGKKVVVGFPGTNLIKFTIKKERINCII